VFLISDFRPTADVDGARRSLAPAIGRLAARRDIVSIVVTDPRDRTLPDVGRIRIGDPERPTRTRVLDTHDPDVRVRYAAAARQRAHALERDLRRAGSDVVWLPTDHDPLRVLARFFYERAARVGVSPA